LKIESALVVLVPEAENLVEDFRSRFDPSAGWGIPAHITILYPFISPQVITEENLEKIKTVFQPFAPFTANFSRVIEEFEMIFLAPEPKTSFVELTEAMIRAFPGYLPYEGAHKEIIPHLSVAIPADPAELPKIAADFRTAAREKMPFSSQITEVTLMENLSGKWKIRTKFPLGKSS